MKKWTFQIGGTSGSIIIDANEIQTAFHRLGEVIKYNYEISRPGNYNFIVKLIKVEFVRKEKKKC